jgi:GNAT superfamily N-acetyltransferase
MIRPITYDDILPLLHYGDYFWKQSPYHEAIEYNPEAVEELLIEMAQNHYLRVTTDEEDKILGFIGIVITPFHFNPNYSMGSEIFFFVHPEARDGRGKELFKQAEEDLKDRGVTIISFGDMVTSKDMKEYYTQEGYEPLESSYVKVIH